MHEPMFVGTINAVCKHETQIHILFGYSCRSVLRRGRERREEVRGCGRESRLWCKDELVEERL